MRIRRLDLARYGRFTGATLDFGDRAEGGPDLHIVYGPNESGKTTAFNALLDLLFGIPDRHPYPYAFLHGWTALKVGAVVEGEDGRHHRLERVGRRGESLFTGDGAPADPMLLQGLLHGLGRHEFEMMFSLDESRLRDGGEAILKSEGDLGRMLFSAAAGLSDFATRFDALSADAAAFHAPRKRSGGLADLKAKLAEVDAALAKADVKVSDYRKLRDAFDAADRAFEEARQARDAARREERRLTAMAEAEQVMRDLQEAEERLAPLADLPLLPPGAETDVADLRTNRAAAAMALRLAEEEGERLRATRADLVLDPEILGAETEIAALEAAVAVAAKVEQDLPRRHEERQEAHEALLALEAALPPGLDWEPALGDTAPIDRLDQLLAQQGALIEAARSAEQELKKAEAEWTAIGTRLQRLGIAPDAASVDLDPQALGAMLRRLRDRDPVRALDAARTAADKANQALHQAIGRLAPWRGDAEELRDQEMPTADQATSWREAWRMLEDERRQNEQVLRAAGADAAEATALIDAMTAAEGLVSDDALQEARAARDTAWERHLAALDETTAAAFADRLAAHDALVERRLAAGEATARLAEAQRSAAQASARRASAEKASTLVRGRQAALVAEIGPPLRLVGLIDDTDPRSDHPSEVVAAALDALPAWLARREDALARLTESVEADHAAAVAEQAAEAARAELATALDDTVDTTLDATVDAAAETPLPRLLERLESAVEAAKARSAAAAEALRARDEAAKSREDRRHRAEAAEAALETWRQDWAMAVGQLPQALATLPPDALRPHLPALRALPERRRSLDELDRRIARMAEDLTASTTAATALSTQFALADAPDAPPREVVHRLRTRLNAAQSAAEKSARLLAEAEAAATKLQTARIELEEINARLAEIAALFPSPEALKTPEALATAVSQAAERARLAEGCPRLETVQTIA
ncbi:MAG: AAA family ATPase [Pseudomonadota bacterium]